MSAVDNAISDVLFVIPNELLRAAFMGDQVVYRQVGLRTVLNTTLNDAIRAKIIDAKVSRDCNNVGGEEVIIPLRNVEFWKPDNFTTVFRLNKAMLQGRSIQAVLAAMYGYPDALYGTPGTGIGAYSNPNMMNASPGAIVNAQQGLLTSYGPAPEVQLANIALVAPNTIAIYETQIITNQLTLRCRVTNDPELNNIPSGAWTKFSKLVMYAVQAFIYKELWIKIDQGQIMGGVELGTFKELVGNWSDAAQNYDDYLANTWTSVAAYSNKLGKFRAIRRGTQKR